MCTVPNHTHLNQCWWCCTMVNTVHVGQSYLPVGKPLASHHEVPYLYHFKAHLWGSCILSRRVKIKLLFIWLYHFSLTIETKKKLLNFSVVSQRSRPDWPQGQIPHQAVCSLNQKWETQLTNKPKIRGKKISTAPAAAWLWKEAISMTEGDNPLTAGYASKDK